MDAKVQKIIVYLHFQSFFIHEENSFISLGFTFLWL